MFQLVLEEHSFYQWRVLSLTGMHNHTPFKVYLQTQRWPTKLTKGRRETVPSQKIMDETDCLIEQMCLHDAFFLVTREPVTFNAYAAWNEAYFLTSKTRPVNWFMRLFISPMWRRYIRPQTCIWQMLRHTSVAKLFHRQILKGASAKLKICELDPKRSKG